MASATLSKLIQNDRETKQELKQINGTLQKMYSLQLKSAKDEARAAKRAAQAAKRKSGDQSLRDLFGVDKKEVKKEQKNFLQQMLDGLLGGLGGLISSIGAPAILGALGLSAIGSAIAGYIASEKFRSFVNDFILKPLGGILQRGVQDLYGGIHRFMQDRASQLLGGGGTVQTPNVFQKAGEDFASTMRQAIGGVEISARERQTNRIAQSSADNMASSYIDRMLPSLNEKDDAIDLEKEKFYREVYNTSKLQSSQFEQMDNMTRQLKQAEDRKAAGDNSVVGAIEELTINIKQKEAQLERTNKLLMELKKREIELLKREAAIKNWSNPARSTLGDYTGLQTGGPVRVPGKGDGDKVPAILPQGSFVLNKKASGFQNGGLVPAMLEPGEQVYGPGQWGPREWMLNKAIPRFQGGGIVQLGKDMIADGYKAWQHPDFNLDSGYTGSGKERNMRRNYDSRHNHGAALDFPASHNSIAQLDALYAKLNTPEAKSKYGITQLLWRGVPGHGPDLAPDNAHLHVATGGAQDFRGNGGSSNGPAKDDSKSGGSGIIGLMNFAGDFVSGMMEGISDWFGSSGGLGNIMNMIIGQQASAGGGGGGATGGSGNAGGGAASISNPNAKALLNALAEVEGTSHHPNQGYNTQFTGTQFNTKGHPREIKSSGRHRSDAAGRYQFLSTTWDSYNNGVDDMSPENQDKVALRLVAEKRGVNINDGLSMSEIPILGREWASIPGGGYGQDRYTAAQFMEIYKKYGGVEQKMLGGGISSVSGYSGGSSISQRSEDQFIEKLAAATSPIVVPVPTGGGGGSAAVNSPAQSVPNLAAYPSNTMALDLANRLSLGASFA